MLFNSISFAIFLPIVFALHWLVAGRSLKWQNILLLVASYYFYACWDWRFMFLLIFSTLLDYYSGLFMASAKNMRRKTILLWLSAGINLGFLGVFKYFNFFASSLSEGLSLLGIHANFWTLQIILPVGISFYTFHGLSYVIDIYKDRIKPEKNFIQYSLFVSFFPLLVAGPIERATHLLPQIKVPRRFNYEKGVDGLRQILWGLFKKIVIADQCARYANDIFNHSSSYSGSTLVIGALLFTFQIYGDFSGYSDIALGTSRLFGVELLQNFAFPYFSRDIAEFWRRWHISLSSWFRDYLYFPLGGSKGGTWMRIRNTFIIFLVSGFWHGANWTFIIWGGLNALFIMPSVIFKTNRNNLDIVGLNGRPTLRELLQIVITFTLTVFAWIFFRARDVSHAFSFIGGIFSRSLLSAPQINPKVVFVFFFVFVLLFAEWLGRRQKYALEHIEQRVPFHWQRWTIYLVIVAFILSSVTKGNQQFIYFQF